MKKIMIEIPDNEIPEKQEVITCDIHFVDGQVCECTYPFEEVNENKLEKIKNEIEDTGAHEQEVNGKTEFLKGINYCLSIIDKYKPELKEYKYEPDDWDSLANAERDH